MAVIMGDPAYLNPGVVLGQIIVGGLGIGETLIYLAMELWITGVAECRQW